LLLDAGPPVVSRSVERVLQHDCRRSPSSARHEGTSVTGLRVPRNRAHGRVKL